jgi:hypothetical protein
MNWAIRCNEIPEIRDSIRETLQAQNGPADATILFGSAHWATHALDGDWDDLGEASARRWCRWPSTRRAAGWRTATPST